MNNELDPEWVELLEQAREYGISINEIKNFLQETKQPENEAALVNK